MTALVLGVASLVTAASSPAQSKGEIVIGLQCDRTGATQIVGTVLCPGLPRLRRARELQGRRRGAPAQGARDRPRVQGAAGRRVLRAPQEGRRGDHGHLRHAPDLRARGQADGRPDPRDLAGLRQRRRRRRAALSRTSSPSPPPTGRRAAAAVDFVKKQLGGSLKGKKIAYLFYDNPAGREPIDLLEDIAEQGGLPAQDVRGPAARRRDGRPGARHRAALPGGLRHLPPVRRRAVGLDQGAEADRLSDAQGHRARVGLG